MDRKKRQRVQRSERERLDLEEGDGFRSAGLEIQEEEKVGKGNGLSFEHPVFLAAKQ